MRMTIRHDIDITDSALAAAIEGTLRGTSGAADGLATLLAYRCVDRVVGSLRQKYPDMSKGDLHDLVQGAAADVVLRVQAGKLTSFDTSATGYLFITCEHMLAAKARRQKGHEELFGDVTEELEERMRPYRGLSSTTTIYVLNALGAVCGTPEQAAIAREMLWILGAQVGRLPRRPRQVIARIRQGMDYPEIAGELEVTEATVRSTYKHAKDQLRAWLGEDGAVDALFLPRHPLLAPGLPRRKLLEILKAFVRSISEESFRTFQGIHFKGWTIADAAEDARDCRAAAEALLAYAHWAIRRQSGLEFPKEFLWSVLDPHPRYPAHSIPFAFW